MKSAKVNRNAENMKRKKCEHDEELWLVRIQNNKKKHSIGCALSENNFEMKLTKMICKATSVMGR
jgi:hypothetical protein